MAVRLINSTPSEIYYVNWLCSGVHARSEHAAIVDKLNKLPSTKGTILGKTRISSVLLNTAAAAATGATRQSYKLAELRADEAANTFVDV